MFSPFKAPLQVGLDINAEEIRLLQLKPVRKRYFVENFAIASLPPGVVKEGKIIEFSNFTAVLERLVRETKTAGSHAAMALPANRVISKRIKLSAKLPPEEYEAVITANFPHYFPGLQDELCFDYAVFAGTPPEALVVAARLEQLNSYIQAADRAGLKIKIVDVDIYALVRAARGYETTDSITGLLDVAPEITQFILFHQGEIIFSQHCHTEENNILTAEITRALQWCEQSQPNLKIKNCLLSGIVAKASAILPVESALHFIHANPLLSLPRAARVNAGALENVGTRLMTCYGLALKSTPTW